MTKFRPVFLIFLFATLFFSSCLQEKLSTAETEIILENEKCLVKIELQGGMYTDFHLKNNPANPFTWEADPQQMPENNKPYVFKGHFLCSGRWGAPSDEEMEAGIPHNGEVNTRMWTIFQALEFTGGLFTVGMECAAPIEKLDVKRFIEFPASGSWFSVREEFTNNLPVGKQSNFVQHPTIAPPFLNENTLLNTNATLGFDQRSHYDSLEFYSFAWPDGKMADGERIDLRTVTSETGYVTSHIFPVGTEYGWITALNPDKNLLLGYIWKTDDYPWLNVWHHYAGGKPVVQGLEFGTTGPGKPYRLLLNNNVSFFGHNSFEFIEAGETLSKSFLCFQIEVPQDFGNVKDIQIDNEIIRIYDASGKKVEITDITSLK